MNRILTFLFTFIVLAACSPLQSARPPVTLLRLEPVPIDLPNVSAIDIDMVPELEGEGVALVMEGGTRMEYAANARWAAPLEELLEAAIDSSLPASPDGDLLNVRVEQFHVRDWNGSPTVAMRWRVARCIKQDCREARSYTIERSVLTEQSLNAIGAAYQQAFAEAIQAIVTVTQFR